MRRLLLAAAAALPACVQQAPAPPAPDQSISVAFLSPPPGASLAATDGGLLVIAVAQSPGSPVVSQTLAAGETQLGIGDGGAVAQWRIRGLAGSQVLTVTATNAAGNRATARRSIGP